jgi:hypothetical protein
MRCQVISVGVGRRDATCCANIFLSKDGEGDLVSVIYSQLMAINFFIHLHRCRMAFITVKT